MIQKYIFLGMAATLLAACCKEKYRTEDYYVRYMQQEHNFIAEAKFTEGLDSNSIAPVNYADNVSFQGYSMALSKSSNTYQFRERLDFSPKVGFLYKDSEQREHSYNLSMTALDSIAVNMPLSRSKGGMLQIMGTPISADEQLILLINDKDRQTVSITIQGVAGNQQLIPAGQMNDLVNGPCEIYALRRQSRRDTSQPHTTIYTTTEFYSKTYQAALVD